jgi:parvulin-like peptidyl-prolyl isomerase
MRSALFVLPFILILLTSSAYCETSGFTGDLEAGTIDRVIARVDSEAITFMEVRFLQENNPDLTHSAALDALIDQRLVLSWARSSMIMVSQEDIMKTEKAIMESNNFSEERFDEVLASRGQDRETFREELKDQILVNKALSLALEPAMRIDEKEIEQRYEELYPSRSTFTLRHILLKPDPSNGQDEAYVRELAVNIMDRIREGTPFEDMALEHSVDKISSGEGGYLGTFSEGELLPELEKMALKMEPGELGGPVQTTMGIHVLKLEEKGFSEPPPLSRVRDKIRAELISQREPGAREKWLRELRENAYIEIFTDGE